MSLTEGQVQVRDLVMGQGTSYKLREFNPWSRQVRADQGGARAWNHGAWSGAEWMAEAVVPLTIRVVGDTAAGWLALHQELMVAFAPSHDDIEMRWVTGGTEFLMFGRPRLVDPNIKTLGRGNIVTRAALVMNDPLIYSGTLHSQVLVLPTVSGGLTVPLTVPFTIGAAVISGRAPITNAGKTTAGLTVRIDGPVIDPRVTIIANGAVTTLTIVLTLVAGQWLDIDTAARTVHLNGTASRRGKAYSNRIDWPLLPPGTHELAFDAALYDASAQLTASWRDAW